MRDTGERLGSKMRRVPCSLVHRPTATPSWDLQACGIYEPHAPCRFLCANSQNQSEKESRLKGALQFPIHPKSRKSSSRTALPSSSYCSLCSPKTLTEVQTDILEAWPGSPVQARLWGCTGLSSQERPGLLPGPAHPSSPCGFPPWAS